MKILQTIIDDYISTAEPIGSRTIARKHELGLSSATIRNEMADLEEMGFLAQPHTSAGRIPSDKGYRFYVDRLMTLRELTNEETESMRNELEMRINELSQLIRQASAVMSRFTKYTSMAITPQMNKSEVNAVQLVPVLPGKALIIVVTNTGVVRNLIIKVSEKLTADSTIRISNIINTKLCGLSLEHINAALVKELEREMGMYKEDLAVILQGVYQCIHEIDDPQVYLEGTTHIFNHPEFNDVARAKEFLNMMDEKDILYKLLSFASLQTGVNVQIGSENSVPEMHDCSLITATYKVGNFTIGSLGVIGPTRMDYGRVISSMNYIRRKINQEISRLLGEEE